MVSQVVCVICSVLPEPHTTEITFYKFPKATVPDLYKAWKNALVAALSNDRPELSDDANLNDTYICSRHFTASDFAFANGKLILLKDAIPTRITKNLYDVASTEVEKITKEYEPTARGNNFASTLTKDYVTTSHHNLRSDLISTETSRALTPSISEFITSMRKQSDSKISYVIAKGESDTFSAKKRHTDLEQKVESYGKIFKRLHSDNLLTESYVDKLKVRQTTFV